MVLHTSLPFLVEETLIGVQHFPLRSSQAVFRRTVGIAAGNKGHLDILDVNQWSMWKINENNLYIGIPGGGWYQTFSTLINFNQLSSFIYTWREKAIEIIILISIDLTNRHSTGNVAHVAPCKALLLDGNRLQSQGFEASCWQLDTLGELVCHIEGGMPGFGWCKKFIKCA